MISPVDSVPLDAEKIRRSLQGVCFICEIVKGHPNFYHHVFYNDGTYIAFLDKYPMLVGASLVAPKAHLEQLTGDFPEEEYLALQRLVYRVGEALRPESFEDDGVGAEIFGIDQCDIGVGNSQRHLCLRRIALLQGL